MAKTGIDALLLQWVQKHGYHWAEFYPRWDDIDAEDAIVRTRNGRSYNALAAVWANEEMVEVCTRGITFYDGVSPDTQDMIDQIANQGHPCKVYLFQESDEPNHAEKPPSR